MTLSVRRAAGLTINMILTRLYRRVLRSGARSFDEGKQLIAVERLLDSGVVAAGDERARAGREGVTPCVGSRHTAACARGILRCGLRRVSYMRRWVLRPEREGGRCATWSA
jgi:hypothetical protein